MVLRICVIGAGNIGLSTAYHLKSTFPCIQICVIAEHFLEQTTSYGAGGVWEPYTVGETPLHLIEKWGRASYDHYLRMAASEVGNECGVQILNVYQLLADETPSPWWSSIPIGFRTLTALDTSRLGFDSYKSGYTYTTVVIDQKYHMRFLTRELKKLGVDFIQQHIDSFSELDYDIVVNCTGLGSRHLCDDQDIHPARGQVVRVHAPWIKEAWFLGPDYYLIPNIDTLVIGGTLEKDNWNTGITAKDTELIMKNVCNSFPSLAHARVEQTWVGLRPCRSTVRLETEIISSVGRDLPVIHCYGHGGSGITLGVGSVLDMIENYITPLVADLSYKKS